MKLYLLIFIILHLAQFICCNGQPKEYYDLNDGEQHVEVVRLIFTKLNTILNETTQITHRLDGLNKRFDELDLRTNKIVDDFTKFKTDITKRVEDQAKAGVATTNALNKRVAEFQMGVSSAAQNTTNMRNEMTKMVQDQNDNFKKEINAKFADMSQLLQKSSNDITVFKASISRTVEEHTAMLRHKVNETMQNQERQENQIKLLWETKNEWHVILRRKDGSVDFNRNWTEYKNGFGDISGEFFVGMETLHRMTTNGLKHELFIELRNAGNRETYAKYDNVVIGSETEKYKLKELGDHSGNAEDALSHHVDEKFTTLDQDNDEASGENCARIFGGPWWFYQCNPSSNLFGPYKTQHVRHRMRWGPSVLNELKFVEVKIRQV